MLFQVASRFAKTSLVAAAIVAVAGPLSLGSLGAHAADKGATQWPSQVKADYGITFNGFDIGSFRLKSKVTGQRYVLDGDAELSALLGAFKWRGTTRSSGRLVSGAPKPEGYVFNFRSSAKTGMIGLSFGRKGVQHVSMVPQIPVAAGEVPLSAKHLKGVYDPLSAVMVLAHGVKGQPCAATIPVFDGKQRFDLALYMRRREMLPLHQTGGRAVPIYVCGVKYRPIAGFKPTAAIKAMAESNGFEVTMRRVTGSGMFIPNQITIPTMAGPVVLSAKKIDVMPAGSRRVAQMR